MPIHTRIAWISSAALFLLLALLFTGAGQFMFGDGDPLWHLLAGDLILSEGALPFSDPWSYTAGETRWYNMSWLWDVGYSIAHQHLGWHGVMALNAMFIAATFTLIYLLCLLRTGDGMTAFLVILLAAMMMPFHLRPLQVSLLMMALWTLLLSQAVRGRIDRRWLAALPITMLLWVNMHGGALIGGVLIGVYWLHANANRDRKLANTLLLAGFAVGLAMLCNPYGIYILDAALQSLNSAAKPILTEWMPMQLTAGTLAGSLFAVLFVLMVPRTKLPNILPAERWLAYALLLAGLLTIRYMHLFVIVAAPLLACALKPHMQPRHAPAPLALRIRAFGLKVCMTRAALITVTLACATLVFALPSPPASRFYPQEGELFPSIAGEIEFLRTHYPHARILNHWGVGSLLLYQADTEIPVFIDGRAETAYPREVVQAYVDYSESTQGWEAMLDQYDIDIVMVSYRDAEMLDRFRHRRFWREVYVGKHTTLFARNR